MAADGGHWTTGLVDWLLRLTTGNHMNDDRFGNTVMTICEFDGTMFIASDQVRDSMYLLALRPGQVLVEEVRRHGVRLATYVLGVRERATGR